MAMSVKTMNMTQCRWYMNTSALEDSIASNFRAGCRQETTGSSRTLVNIYQIVLFNPPPKGKKNTRILILSEVFLNIFNPLVDTELSFGEPY